VELAPVLQWYLSMLVISRRKGQRVSIGEEIELVITEVHRSSVKLGIVAPRGLTVLRGEIRDSIEAANRAAASSSVEDGGALGAIAPVKGAEISAIPVTVLRRPAAARPKDDKPA
jgi:carbon storage regulator